MHDSIWSMMRDNVALISTAQSQLWNWRFIRTDELLALFSAVFLICSAVHHQPEQATARFRTVTAQFSAAVSLLYEAAYYLDYLFWQRLVNRSRHLGEHSPLGENKGRLLLAHFFHTVKIAISELCFRCAASNCVHLNWKLMFPIVKVVSHAPDAYSRAPQ